MGIFTRGMLRSEVVFRKGVSRRGFQISVEGDSRTVAVGEMMGTERSRSGLVVVVVHGAQMGDGASGQACLLLELTVIVAGASIAVLFCRVSLAEQDVGVWQV